MQKMFLTNFEQNLLNAKPILAILSQKLAQHCPEVLLSAKQGPEGLLTAKQGFYLVLSKFWALFSAQQPCLVLSKASA